MKVRPSVKPMCEKCKIIKRKRQGHSYFVRIPSTSRDKVNRKVLKQYGTYCWH